MAYTATGSWVGGDDWYAWLNVSKSNTSDTVTKVTVTGGIYNVYAVASYFTADITSDSAGNTTNYSVGSISEYSGEKTVKTNNINVTRGTSQKTLTVMCRVNGSGGYSGSSSTAKTTVTIPAKTSYTITYNANGGTGAPPNQTKWYGDALTLSTTVPTRTDYNFKGWNTAADGTGTYSYNAGCSYPADRNGNVTLYAQWELAYARPTISDLSLIRCTNASGYPASEEGTYAKLSFKWAFDTHASSGTYAVQWREVGQTNWNNDRSGTLSGNTGTFAYTLLTKSTFSASTSYQIQLTITDGNKPEYSTSVITVLTQGFAHIVLGGPNHLHSVGIGKSPTKTGALEVALDFDHSGGVTLDATAKAAWQTALGVTKGTSTTSYGTWNWIIIDDVAIAEYRQSSTHSVSSLVQWGSLYYHDFGSLTFPSNLKFSEIPQVSVSFGMTADYILWGATTQVTKTGVGHVYAIRVNTTTETVTLCITVIGKVS